MTKNIQKTNRKKIVKLHRILTMKKAKTKVLHNSNSIYIGDSILNFIEDGLEKNFVDDKAHKILGIYKRNVFIKGHKCVDLYIVFLVKDSSDIYVSKKKLDWLEGTLKNIWALKDFREVYVRFA